LSKVKQEFWRLEVVDGDCGICDLCALACSNEKFGIMDPKMSAIKINHRPKHTHGRDEGSAGILPCWHCLNPPCIEACPYDAMSIDEHNVVRLYLTDAPEGYKDCTSCNKCVKACENMHGEPSIFISKVKDRHMQTKSGRDVLKYSLYKCDFCSGDPACVKICPRAAIKFIRYQPSKMY
jgi:electron transport protein HydN